MANHYLKATGNWSAAATWSDTDGGAAGAAAPVDGDAVFFTANGNGLTCTIDALSACSSILASGATTATLAGTQTINVSGNVTLLATMTVPNTISINVTGIGNFAGALTTLGTIQLNGTAHTVSGAFTCLTLRRTGTATKTDTVTFTSGTTVTCTNFALIGNSATNRLLVQASTLGSAATITATNQAFENVDFMDITLTNAYDHTANLLTNAGFETGDPPTGWAVKNDTPTIARVSSPTPQHGSYCIDLVKGAFPNPYCSQDFVNYVHLLGISVTLKMYGQMATGTTSPYNCKIVDIQNNNGGFATHNDTWVLKTIVRTIPTTSTKLEIWIGSNSAVDGEHMYFDDASLLITGTIGDCGGNTNITFTPAVAQTFDGTTASWSTAARWTSRVPLPQDDVSAGGAGDTITVDMPRIGKSITFTGTPTVSLSNSISVYGSKTLVSGMTWTPGTNTVTMRGRSAYTITSAGKTLYNPTISAPNGTYTLQDDTTVSNIFAITNGTFIDGGKTITLTATGAVTKWSATGGTVTATGTIILTSSLTNAQTFAGGGLTYNNLAIQGAGAYALTITGNNTFNNITLDTSAAAKTIVATGTTQTVASMTHTGTTNAVITGGTWTKSGGGFLSLPRMTISGATGTPASTWRAPYSTDGGGNTGWNFLTTANMLGKLIALELIYTDKDNNAPVKLTQSNGKGRYGA